jgi:hypothetical protein
MEYGTKTPTGIDLDHSGPTPRGSVDDMPQRSEHLSDYAAPVTGIYRLLYVFGAETETSVYVMANQMLPMAPIGHTWRLEREFGER